MLLALALTVAGFAAADVTVDVNSVVGKIKPMNGVNNGPAGPFGEGNSQCRDNYETYRAAHIPFARTHDAAFSESYGSEHTVDITAVFPDFSRKADDPSAYHFEITDWYLKRIRSMGTEVFFRLGQKIEHHVRKYGIMPPADFKKWAQVCEHIVRHYNEGWANGYRWNLCYWEIWNEADLDVKSYNTNPRTWGGTEQQFFDFYATAAKHLKKCFPNLRIGGPALAGNEQWAERFLHYQQKEDVPLDFFSWHIYSTSPQKMAEKAQRIRILVDKYGYSKAETILNEWNYIRGWTQEFPYSLQSMRNEKGAAFCAATMVACQNAPVDILMYYDARPETPFNGLWDFISFKPTAAYYSFYAWGRLASLGTQIKTECTDDDVFAIAAKGNDGKVRVLVVRYNENANVTASKTVKLHVPGLLQPEAVCNVVDAGRLYSQTLLQAVQGGLELEMEPNSLRLLEFQF